MVTFGIGELFENRPAFFALQVKKVYFEPKR